MTEKQSSGIVYVAIGDPFVKEARLSAEQAKSVMPEVPITLITDVDVSNGPFDDIISINNGRGDGGDRVFQATSTPYDRTLFLDTDIYIAEPINEVFDLLDRFDVAACINQRKYSSERIDIPEINDLPDSFPEYNGGVLAYRANDRTDTFLSLWQEMFETVVEHGQIHNQAALRYALYRSDVRIATLRNEYNCVFRRPGCVNGPVKVFHGRLLGADSYGASRSINVEQAAAEINSDTDLRVYYTLGDRIRISKPNIFQRLVCSIRDRGLITTTKLTISQLK